MTRSSHIISRYQSPRSINVSQLSSRG